jgi:hypothetical protein
VQGYFEVLVDTLLGAWLPAWRPRDGAALQALIRQRVVQRGFGIYLGKAPQRDGTLNALPLSDFLTQLHRGKILS